MKHSADITTPYLAKLQGVTERAIQKRAAAEGWPHKMAPGRGRGGEKRSYSIEDLPSDIQTKHLLREHSESQTLPDLDRARESMSAWERATEAAKEKAIARKEIVENFEIFRLGRKLTKAREEFCARHNAQNIFLGISEKTFQTIPKISPATIDRYRLRYKTLGLPGLLDKPERGKPKGRLTSEHKEHLIGLQVQNPHRRPTWICKYFKNKFGRVVCKRTIYRFLRAWKAENREYYTYIKNPDEWRSNFQVAHGDAGKKAAYFLQMVEFDGTPADILCADGKRYTLMAAIDIYSRKVICSVVPTGNSVGTLNLIRQVIKEFGLFDLLIRDNGKDFCANDVDVACAALGIETWTLPPFAPQKKPFVESFFRTLSIFLEELPGFCGHDVAQRKEIEARQDFAQRMFSKDEVVECTLEWYELQESINTWIEVDYHQRTHRTIGMCPEAKAAQSPRPVKRIEDERVLCVLLAPCGERVVGKSGIQFENGTYVDVELADHIGKRVRLRRDLFDFGRVYVFDLEGQFICIARDVELEGVTLEEAKAARKRQATRVREEARTLKALSDPLGDPMAELLASKSRKPGQVHGIHRQEVFEDNTIKQAARAVEERMKQEEEGREEVREVVGGESIFSCFGSLGHVEDSDQFCRGSSEGESILSVFRDIKPSKEEVEKPLRLIGTDRGEQ